jgi:hypothetical protein
MVQVRHRWLFEIEGTGYVDAQGLGVHGEDYFEGTEEEARAEAGRRSELAAEAQGVEGQMTMEGHGVIE